MFDRAAEQAVGRRTPTVAAVAAALPSGGSVLDIGCGAGAASLPVADAAGTLIGVDESAEMLAAFATRARDASVAVATHVGRWPDIAADVAVADVAVARNVAYNVPDLGEVAAAMTAHARQRVVLELTERHPLHWMNPLWVAVHGIQRPDAPTVDDAVAVFEERGLDVSVERWSSPGLLAGAPSEEIVDFMVRRLCLGDDRADEVRQALVATPVPTEHEVATVWWAGGA